MDYELLKVGEHLWEPNEFTSVLPRHKKGDMVCAFFVRLLNDVPYVEKVRIFMVVTKEEKYTIFCVNKGWPRNQRCRFLNIFQKGGGRAFRG